MIRMALIGVAVALACAACKTIPGDTDPPAPKADVAKICDVNSLGVTHAKYRERMERLEADVDEDPAISRMRKFRAEIDGQYRSVVAACKAYMLCMDANGYNEDDCIRSQRRWLIAERRFNELSVRLARMERRRGKKRGRYKEHDPCDDPCDEIASEFTACCAGPDDH